MGRSWIVDGIRATGENDAFDVGILQRGKRRRKRKHLRIDVTIPNAPGDQLVILAPEIQDDDFLHSFSPLRAWALT